MNNSAVLTTWKLQIQQESTRDSYKVSNLRHMEKKDTEHSGSNKYDGWKLKTRKIWLVDDTFILGKKHRLNRRGLNGGDGPHAYEEELEKMTTAEYKSMEEFIRREKESCQWTAILNSIEVMIVSWNWILST